MPSEEYAQCNFLWFDGFHKCIYDGIYIEIVPVSAMQGLVGTLSEEAVVHATMCWWHWRMMQMYPSLSVYDKEL